MSLKTDEAVKSFDVDVLSLAVTVSQDDANYSALDYKFEEFKLKVLTG